MEARSREPAEPTAGDAAQPRIAITIPCFNEAPTIQRVVSDFSDHLPDAQIYVFDNNSTDGSGELAREAGAEVIPSPVQGKGHVLQHMTEVVNADVYIVVDGDGTYPAAAAPKMLEQFFHEGLDMLVATRLERYEEGSFRTFHRFGNLLITRTISLLFGARLTDVLSGYRILSRSFVELVRIRTRGFEVETEMTLQCLTKKLALAERPVEYGRRPRGSQSKLNTWSDGLLILRCIMLIFKDYKPLLFFSSFALVFGVASLATGSAPIRDYLETRYVLHVPRAILAASLAIVAMICVTVGLVLDTISKYHLESIELWKRLLRQKH